MIRINLLPFRAAKKKANVRRQIVLYVVSIFVVLAPLIGFHIKLKNDIASLEANIKKTEKDLAAQKKRAAKVDAYQKKLNRLQKKLEAIESLQLGRRETFNLLVNVTKLIVPKRMWLTSFAAKDKKTTTGKKKNRKTVVSVHVQIKGIALDEKTVADYMANLEDSGVFSAVTLVVTSEILYNKANKLKQFTFKCVKKRLKPKQEEKPKKKKGTKKKGK